LVERWRRLEFIAGSVLTTIFSTAKRHRRRCLAMFAEIPRSSGCRSGP